MAYFKTAAMNKLIDLVRTAISQISSTDTDHAQVTAEALVDLNARLEALENAGTEDYGDIVAETIDLVEFPMIAGASTVLFGSGTPTRPLILRASSTSTLRIVCSMSRRGIPQRLTGRLP